MSSHHFAQLRPSSRFFKLFPDGRIPIQSPSEQHTQPYRDPGYPEGFYLVDFSRLNPLETGAVLVVVMQMFNADSLELVRQEIAKRGLPIRASQVERIDA